MKNTIPVLSPEQAIAAADAFREQFAAGSSRRDRSRQLPYREIEQLKQSGLLALRVPRQFGGAEIDMLTFSRVLSTLAAGDPNIAQAVAPQFTNLEKLRLYGNDSQKKRYFSHALAGGLMSNAAAEKGGNFIGDVSTALQRLDSRWRLDGRKAYSTGSLFSTLILVTALHPDGGRAAVFVPVDRPGVKVHDDWDGMGQRTTSSGTTEYHHVIIEEDEILPAPAFGQRRTHEGSFAQLIHSAIDAGIARAALEDACAYGREHARVLRDSGVETATEDPYVLHTVGEMAIQTHGADALLERGARLLDKALEASYRNASSADRLLAEASVAIAEAKYATTEASLRVSESLFRLGGASATTQAMNLDRHWRNARTHTTHDPVSYKARAVGDYYLNGTLPPINTKI
ncbi:SfnB family sulfur acquisition oxidoreductase [Biostraticola tofi]|uniref:SfnB family sulfur acquisition oxidoreductase n=1 Tax=Biostraticola tofi TaxID=466109 RepID=A0A4R3YZW8_9GAMM|nr:SfnB family sulfur acquisition oxidoreductase [Biostraticola tofi]TCV98870.1 SfnB family sulfur acquisition oxidoreductase [Biostraticola tofi]